MKANLGDILRLPAEKAAPQLLGWIIERKLPEGVVRLKIVETEAYHQDDPASHSFRGITKRTAPMFSAGGAIYVYFSYGMHYCLNIVTGAEGRGEAVLLRAAEPLEGLEIMAKYRQVREDIQLANGPAKLTQALGIVGKELSGQRLGPNTINLRPPAKPVSKNQIIASERIGISKAKDKPWRFYIKASRYVSRLA